MAPRTPLTPEQRAAAFSPQARLLVVASPGCGKTTVAAERFGLHRFSRHDDHRRCLALSFTRAATGELGRRIRERWGPAALSWPHRAMTLDALHVELVHVLLRTGAIRWPNGHTALVVEDSWRGQRGVVRRDPGQYVAAPVLRGGDVAVHSVRHQGIAVTRIGQVADLRSHFDEGRCTHLEVREVLGVALVDPALRGALETAIRESTKAIVVDEIFDGNDVDTGVLRLAAGQGVDVSVIGDPWQAVYEFRGADPRRAHTQLTSDGFIQESVATSFRFRTGTTQRYNSLLRSRQPCVLPLGSAGNCDVVLASEWDTLWACDDGVLPLSFGIVRNQTDAAMLLLLDHVVERRLRRRAVYVADAHAFLRTAGAVDPADLRDEAERIVGLLADPSSVTQGTLGSWRAALRQIGVPAQLRPLRDAAQEARQVENLRALGRRIARRTSVPGMTVHQAKGGEWPSVGLRVSDDEADMLATGLDPTDESARVLYVAVTRAMDDVWIV